MGYPVDLARWLWDKAADVNILERAHGSALQAALISGQKKYLLDKD